MGGPPGPAPGPAWLSVEGMEAGLCCCHCCGDSGVLEPRRDGDWGVLGPMGLPAPELGVTELWCGLMLAAWCGLMLSLAPGITICSSCARLLVEPPGVGGLAGCCVPGVRGGAGDTGDGAEGAGDCVLAAGGGAPATCSRPG